MTKPTLHLLGLPHTQTKSEYSHCAFTGKVQRFSPMLRSVGYHVVHYGIGGAESGANEQVDVMDEGEWQEIRTRLLHEKHGREVSPSDFVGDLADMGNDLYRIFNERLREILLYRVSAADILCLPFGMAHRPGIASLVNPQVETGIGYPSSYAPYRVFESNAWMHYTLGEQRSGGSDYHWVVPNYYNVDEWSLGDGSANTIVYFGRLTQIKGLDIVWEIARARPDLRFVLCGQGDASPWLTLPNIEYMPPIHGKARESLLGDAMAVLMPTRYVEPFGGVTVEAHLCGTPVLGSSFGSFTETVEHGVTGYRCRTLADYLQGIHRIETGALNRAVIRESAANRFDMYKLAWEYDRVFQQVHDLHYGGWYAPTSYWVD